MTSSNRSHLLKGRRPATSSPWIHRLVALVILLALAGCSSANESLVLVAGNKVDAAAIDKDPLTVLPPGVIMLGYLDASAMFASGMGPEVEQLIARVLPLSAEANFQARRDVAKVYSGLYAMQGVDVCAVVQGNFDPDAIARVADSQSTTVTGVPLVKTRYADYDLFTAQNLGFVVLTKHTILSGNEVCMRRALDRLRFSELERSIPTWMIALTETPGAAFAFAGDLSSQTSVEAATQTIPFVHGLKYVRVLGNFQDPGLNFVGTLTYADATAAQGGAAQLANLRELTQFMNMLTSWGVGQAANQLQVSTVGSEVQFSVPLDGMLVRTLLNLISEFLRQ
jgi:hypothetical protein